MKKLFSILFALLLTAGTLAGCGSEDTPETPSEGSGEETAAPAGGEISGDIMIYTSAEDAFISEVCATRCPGKKAAGRRGVRADIQAL